MFDESVKDIFGEVISEAKILARDVKDSVARGLSGVVGNLVESGEDVVKVKRESVLNFLFDESLRDLKRVVGEKSFFELRDILDLIDWCVNVNYVIFRDTPKGVECDVLSGFNFLSEEQKFRIERLKEKIKSLHFVVNL